MATIIYGLICPLSGRIRYIGKTSDPVRRIADHIYTARNRRTYKQFWIAKLLDLGLRPILVTLESVEDGESWADAERRWIAQAKSNGWPITNLASGGEGSSPLDDAARAKKKERMSRPEARMRMSASAKARWADKKKREVALAAARSPDRRKKSSEAAKRRATPEYRKMMSDRSKAAWADKDKRQRILSGITDEVRSKVSESSKRMWATTDKRESMLSNLKHGSDVTSALWANPDYRDKQMATKQTDEFKRNASLGQIRRYSRMRNDP